MLSILDVILLVAAIPIALGCAYLGLLAVLARRRGAAPAERESTIFDVIIPAHDEEEGIGATVDSISRVDYPTSRRRIIVVADNCSDDTAAIAKKHGAVVWERRNPRLRGKGYALAWAFDRSLDEDLADAVVVIDADTLVSRNLLRAFAGRLAGGALAVQADYGVRNTDDSWRTVLM
ncbi:MAG: glycosyltransferase family 2 protein, partial [Myxococcota bacterium]